MLKYGLLAVVLGCFAVGCGGVKEEKIAIPNSAIIQNVKSTLEIYAKSGKLGSGISGLNSDINGITSTDPALGEKLKAAFTQLEQGKSPKEIKAKAQEMLDMIP